MSSMVVGGCRNVDVVDSRGGYWEPVVVITPIFDHKDGHYVRPNRVTFKYLDFKKDVDPNVHVRVFNYVVKANVETFEKYIINAFSYMLRNTASNWCHNYMSKFPNCTFWSLLRHFASIIEKFKMTSKYTWSWRTWSRRRLRGWRFTMNDFKSWLMVYKYQP
jgi:hypothetical protein